MNEGEVRVVERVFHHPQRGRIPSIIELMDAPVGGIAILRQVGDRKQRLLERDPDVAVARVAVERLYPRVGKRLIGRKLRNPHQLAGAIVNGTDSVDLVFKGGARMRAQLDDDCTALGYYGGIYLKTAADGQVCARRDTIRTRSGDSCSIGKFKRLVAKPGKP